MYIKKGSEIMAKLSYEYVKNEIEKKGYKLLEEEYKGCNVKMSILCPNNHSFSTRWRNWQQGVRCPHCKGVAKLNIGIIRQAFKEEGYELLTNEYVNNQGKLEYKCSHGHPNETTWNRFQQGERCSYCSGFKLYEDYIREELEKEGYTLLSSYINSGEKMVCLCPQGHECEIIWDNFKQGHRCKECSKEIISNKNKKSYEEVKDIFEQEGYTLLSTEYKNMATKLEYKCPNNHIHKMTLGNFIRGRRCPSCGNNYKGEIKIKKILDLYNIVSIQQYKFKDCKDIRELPFDFYLPDYDVLIEYDGIQHFDIERAFKKDKFWDTVIHDAMKNSYCEDNNIKLIRIPYWEFDNIENILKQELNLE